MRVLLLDYPAYGPPDAERDTTAELGWELSVRGYDEFVADPELADVLLNVGAWPLPAALLDAIGCAWVVGYGIGLDWIDRSAAAQRGIGVVNMPVANADDVAVHAMTLVLAGIRRVAAFDRGVRDGRFDGGEAAPIVRPSELRLGLLAFGTIARRVATLARPFGFSLHAFDPAVPPDTMATYGVTAHETLDALLVASDVLSVHVPATATTAGLLDRRRLGLLPAGAVVVITSRGEVYDAKALADALHRGQIAAAGIDVFSPEPPGLDHPLIGAPNAILTPHIAGSSVQAIEQMHATAADVLRDIAAGRQPEGLVPPLQATS